MHPWYFEHPLPEGYKKYNKTKPIRIEEFDLEKAWWENRVENECTWSVTIDEIKQRNYNLDIKNPNAIGEDRFLHPLEIIDRIISNETLIKDITLKIRELMKS